MNKKMMVAAALLTASLNASVSAQSSACAGCAGTPNPNSPDCPSGLTWQQQATTGVYTCLAPAPVGNPGMGGGATGGGGGGGSFDATCAANVPAGYNPKSAYTWVDAKTTGGSQPNWSAVYMYAGVPPNAEPIWASDNPGGGTSVVWIGPNYSYCNGARSDNGYTATCWVDKSTNALIQFAMNGTMAGVNNCGGVAGGR